MATVDQNRRGGVGEKDEMRVADLWGESQIWWHTASKLAMFPQFGIF